MIYVVLGMHKSGTTLVAKMLHASGINMGESIDESADYSAGNHYERQSTADINHLLLEGCLTPPSRLFGFARTTDSGPHYPSLSRVRALPNAVRPDDERRMEDVIASCSRQHQDWGFKDPRTCLTYPLWRSRLGPHRVIAVYRGIRPVLSHYRVNGLGQVDVWRSHQVLTTWMRYNEEIVRACRQPGVPSLVVRYERLMDDERERQRLAAFVGRPLADVRTNASPARDREAIALVPWLVSRPHDRRLRDVTNALDALRQE